MWFDGSLTIFAEKKHAAPVKITLVQDKATGKWLATDGLLATDEGREGVIEGHIVRIEGGHETPIRIAGEEVANCTVVITKGKPVKQATEKKSASPKDDESSIKPPSTKPAASAATGEVANKTEDQIIVSLLANRKAGDRFVIKTALLCAESKDPLGRTGPQKATVRLVQRGETNTETEGKIAVVGGYWEKDGGLWMPGGDAFGVRDSQSAQVVFIKKRQFDTIYGYEGVARIVKDHENVADLMPMLSGSLHRFIGDIPFGGCVFRGEQDDPLAFAVVEGVGYVHVGGHGSVVLENGHIVEIAKDGTYREAGMASGDLAKKLQQSKIASTSKQLEVASPLPPFKRHLNGENEVRVRNPNDFAVVVGVRSGDGGKDFEVPANGINSVYLSDGRYDIYFVYSDKPDVLFQGDSFTLNNNGIEIQIVQVVNGNYNIRQVK